MCVRYGYLDVVSRRRSPARRHPSTHGADGHAPTPTRSTARSRASCCRSRPRRSHPPFASASASAEEELAPSTCSRPRTCELPGPRAERAGRQLGREHPTEFLAAETAEFAASVPRVAATGAVTCACCCRLQTREVEAVVMLVTRLAGVRRRGRRARARSSSSRHRLACAARAEAGTDAVTAA